MRRLLRVFYSAAARLASVAPAFVPPSDDKVTMTLRARRGIRRRYASWAARQRDRSRPLLWMHASSVGEGLMARPILEAVRERRPDVQLAYTFFSPSAEEFSRGLDVDFREYLPFDTAPDMTAALDALAPTALVFSKVDVWPELVRQARRRGVALGMTSAALAAGSRRRGPWAGLLLRDAYAALDAVGAVDPATSDRLVELGVRAEVVEVTGDTRFDQVWHRAERLDRASGIVGRLASERPTLVAGSTWPSDEAPLFEAVERLRGHGGGRVPSLRLVLAPHEVTPEHLEPLERWAAARALRLARVDAVDAADADVILVDRYGVLGDLYAVGHVALVGGGFHEKGLHSVLEPASHGVPVLFGPRHTNSRDARLLLDAGGARAVSGAADLEAALAHWLEHPATGAAAGVAARRVVDEGRGAAERSVRLVERLLAAGARTGG